MVANRHRLTDYATLGLFASLTFALQSVAWPLSEGRDYYTYIFYYLDFFLENPSFQTLMVYRTPLSPLVLGLLIDYGGALVTELAMGLLFVVSVSLTYATGLYHSRKIAITAATALMFFPPFGATFHAASGDPIFTTLFVVWVFLVQRYSDSISLRTYALHGLFVALLFLTRPIAQIFIAFVAFPLLLTNCNIWKRLQLALVFLAISSSIGLLWSTHNYIRYDDFTIARGNAAMIPFQRAFVQEKIVHPDNGANSAKFAGLIETELLSKEPYLSYGIDIEQFLHSGSSRIFLDVWVFSDRVWGWDSDHEQLRQVGIEAVTRHPGEFFYGLARDFLYMLSGKYKHNPPSSAPSKITEKSADSGDQKDNNALSTLDELPSLSGRDLIPGPNNIWVASNPLNSVNRNWSNIAAPKYTFATPELEHNYWLREQQVAHLPSLPSRTGNASLSKFLNNITRLIYPSIIVWVIAGLVGLFSLPIRRALVINFPFLLALGAVFITALAANANLHYAFPFFPIFFLFGTVGFSKILRLLKDY